MKCVVAAARQAEGHLAERLEADLGRAELHVIDLDREAIDVGIRIDGDMAMREPRHLAGHLHAGERLLDPAAQLRGGLRLLDSDRRRRR